MTDKNSELESLKQELQILQTKHLKKYEYRIVDDADEPSLIKLGMLGWELVGVTSYSTGGGVSYDGIGASKFTVHVRYALKRELMSESTPEVNRVAEKFPH